jgi:SAM-dependent methyltransferase
MRSILKPVRRLREVVRRRAQADKSPREIFSEVYRSKAWGDHGAFFSGFGSHIRPAIDAYVRALTPLLMGMPNARVTDLGCGDFNIGRHIKPLCNSYIACDVVPELIKYNREKFPDVDFRCIDITVDILPAGDIALVRQVLQHLNNNQISNFLRRLEGYKILIVTEHIPAGAFKPNIDKAAGGGIRMHGVEPSGVDLSEPPFSIDCISSNVLAEVPEERAVLRTTSYRLQ